MSEQLTTQVWILEGLTGSTAAQLRLNRGHLTLRTMGNQLFYVPLKHVSGVRFPWYYFGGGLNLTVDGTQYRLSFVKPTSKGGSVFDIRAGRTVSKAWRKALAR